MVLGLTATEAGLAQMPLMAGFVLTSNVSSLLVQRFGRYKPFIVGGFALLIVAFALMSRLGANTSVWNGAWRVFVMGLGLRPAMPLLNLAMQNAAPPHQIGAVTATGSSSSSSGRLWAAQSLA
jgi:fucose permease